jgi:4-amino-4-deoxy-L-arabinose transferase-like glycosyltransferase
MSVALAIGACIVAVYALALWWLLRGERPATYTALIGLCGVSLALRLVLTHAYPAGLNEDELKNLGCTVQALGRGELLGESCNGPPYLLSAVFAAPLVPLTGVSRWAMRSYSMALSVLATPAAFAVARAMGLRVAAGLAAGGLVAVLPWALFYGRISLGGELIFHQLLLLAALARLVWPEAIARRTAPPGVELPPGESGWREALLAGFALAMLLWDYYAGRTMVGMPLLAALLATGRRRLWCLAVPLVALLLWTPHLSTNPPYAAVGFSTMGLHDGVRADPIGMLRTRTQYALWTFVWPVGHDSIFTVRSAAMHPVFVLVLAGLGALTGLRRCLFLVGGFVGGILPGVVSHMFGISTHRIMMAYVFVALAAACAVDLAPRRWLRGVVTVGVLVTATIWSVGLYFSPRFWPADSASTFDGDGTALHEALTGEPLPPERFISMHQLAAYTPPPPPGGVNDMLTADNWIPPHQQRVTYAFPWQGQPLRAQYERLFPGRVKSAGARAFYVPLEAADWSWLRRHGWWYEVRCPNVARAVLVPFLYSLSLPMTDLLCQGPSIHIWRAHWHGPATAMLLEFSGRVRVEANGLSEAREGYEQRLPLTMPADSDVTVTLAVDDAVPWPLTMLFEVVPSGRRVPDWERFTPLTPLAHELAGRPPEQSAPGP